MTKDELLEAIDREIEYQQAKLRTYDEDPCPWDEVKIEARIRALEWVRDLIEKPPG